MIIASSFHVLCIIDTQRDIPCIASQNALPSPSIMTFLLIADLRSQQPRTWREIVWAVSIDLIISCNVLFYYCNVKIKRNYETGVMYIAHLLSPNSLWIVCFNFVIDMMYFGKSRASRVSCAVWRHVRGGWDRRGWDTRSYILCSI